MEGETSTREQAAVLALARHTHSPWHLIARAIEQAGSAIAIAAGDTAGLEGALEGVDIEAIESATIDAFELEIDELRGEGVDLVTVLDDAYPANLRMVYDRPPFLFVRGRLEPGDERSIAVVGTRQASAEGLAIAARLAAELVEHDIVVLSGMALGIDGAAHCGALEAGGRTIAVIGTGIRRVYPTEHDELAKRIVAEGGAILSQFLPDAPPTKWSFPLRNRTMSGLSLGTTVVEASHTSGARMQARLALEHGKRVLLWRDLVTRERWAQTYAAKRGNGATVVGSIDDVLAVVESVTRPVEQLTLT